MLDLPLSRIFWLDERLSLRSKAGVHQVTRDVLGCAVGIVVGIVVLGFLIQLVPYGQNHGDPPAQAEPRWDSAQTRALAVRACFDCHSNQTVWPWYSNVAPLSWLVQSDVDRGRRRLNFSEWTLSQRGAGESARTVERGEMPPSYYVLLHPSANLSSQERSQLIQGLTASLGR